MKKFICFINFHGEEHYVMIEVEAENFRDAARKLLREYSFHEAYISRKKYPYHVYGDPPQKDRNNKSTQSFFQRIQQYIRLRG